MTNLKTLAERWDIDADLLKADPMTFDVAPRWQRDNLDGYGPDAAPVETIDDFPNAGR